MNNTPAAIITIGDELLIGQVIDTNSAWIAQQLNKLGIDVLRRIAVGDDKQAILGALDEAILAHKLVIITGGLGPTADDITKPLLNEYFGGTMVVDQRVLEHLKDIFTKRNRPFLERNMKQAEVPDVCEVLFNRMGTAPGMWFRLQDVVVIALPGVPFEMVSIMEEEALPRLQQEFSGGYIAHRSIITAGEGESFIADQLQQIEESLPAIVKLAYLPGAGMVRLRLTGRGPRREVDEVLNKAHREIIEKLGKIVLATEDIPIEQAVGDWLRAHSKTLGLAESCTGGNIAHQITQVSGSSDYFTGCIVSYANSVKHALLGVKEETLAAHGAISEEVAKEMVSGALRVLGTDYALSITGLLDKGGESEILPVGTVWMAVADKESIFARKFYLPYDRKRNKEMATTMALLLLWKFMNKQL
jgi:nicotinamide-nucleotide amidase